MKEYFLSDIAEIRFGINARTQSEKGVVCLQGKDFDEFGETDHAALWYVSEDQCKDTDFLQPGDVLFAAKGSRNYAIMWRGEIPRAVASSTFFVIRNLDPTVKPEYLVWYLTSGKATKYFEQNIKQATVRTVSKKVIDQLSVELPNFERQEIIWKIHELGKRNRMISHKLDLRLKKLVENISVDSKTKQK